MGGIPGVKRISNSGNGPVGNLSISRNKVYILRSLKQFLPKRKNWNSRGGGTGSNY